MSIALWIAIGAAILCAFVAINKKSKKLNINLSKNVQFTNLGGFQPLRF